DSDDDNDDDHQSDDEQNVSDNPRTTNDEEETQKDEFDDVNLELKDEKLEGEGKDDKEMADAGHVDAEHVNVNQVVVVQHEDLSIQASPLLTIPVLVIPESSTAPATTIPSPILPFIPLLQQSRPIPTPTTSEATISTTTAPDSSTLTTIHQRLFDLENKINTLRNVDHSLAIHARHTAQLIKEHFVLADVVEKSATDINNIKMEHATKQLESQYTIKSYDKAALKEFDQKRALFETMTTSKTFNKHPKHKALYHTLMKSILVDEDAMNKGVADIQKKSKPDDADRDEDPPAGPDQGLKRRKTSKENEPSKKAKST
nr:hypothetical protein [Tanacetum cinerariifolium]